MTLASAAPTPSLPLIDPSSVERTVLGNGMRVLVRRDASAPVVAIVTHVCAGYFDETDDVVGIAHVLEHMYFKGTPTRGVGEIARATKSAAGYPNAAPTYDYTTLYEVLHDRHRIRRWRIGREPGLRALTREQLVAFYRNFYRPGNTILVVVGDVDADEALREVERRYGALPAG